MKVMNYAGFIVMDQRTANSFQFQQALFFEIPAVKITD